MSAGIGREGDPACGNCRYWKPLWEESGNCRAHPPTPVVLLHEPARIAEGYEPGSFWPVTGRGDWCGEYYWEMAE
jgi:hypothetical protein